MRVIDLREQFVVYVIYSGEGKWYVSDKRFGSWITKRE